MKYTILFLAAITAASCCVFDYTRRIVYEHLAPARLVEEALYIHCMKDHAEVRAIFHLETVSPSVGKTAINFPGNNWPLRLKGLKGYQQGNITDFTVHHNGEKIDWFEEDGIFCFVVDFSRQTDPSDTHLLEFSYTSPYLRHGNARFFGYVLRTGSLWRGSIGRLAVHITHHPDISITVLPPYTPATIDEDILPQWDIGVFVH